jgi:pimeloyl-ACP methyl ester carboxylesterase
MDLRDLAFGFHVNKIDWLHCRHLGVCVCSRSEVRSAGNDPSSLSSGSSLACSHCLARWKHREAKPKNKAEGSNPWRFAAKASATNIIWRVASMTIVLVHGNPETEAIWDDLVPHLRSDDVVRLSPPGFGSAIPSGFDCSTNAYGDWLADELGKLTQPIDLVGHDWGGGHVVRIAMDRPGLIRSWTSDILGCFDPDYVWHDLAQAWQTAGVGEQAVAQMFGLTAEARAERYESLGMTPPIAQKVVAGANRDLGRAVLALYRSAVQPAMRELGAGLPRAAAKPGLALIATEDLYCGGETLARRSAERAGAKVAVLHGAGHWWMCQQPKQGAEAINAFLAKLK